MRRGRYVKGKKVGKGNIANVVRSPAIQFRPTNMLCPWRACAADHSDVCCKKIVEHPEGAQ